MSTAAPTHAPTSPLKTRPSGGYRKTASFQTTTLIYDATWRFCESFLDARSRATDQMVQAARSARQHIVEGSRAAATSSQTELRLINVARASLEELLLDYEDFLRHRRLAQWAPDSPEAGTVRAVAKRFRKDPTDPTDPSDLSDPERWSHYARWLEHADAGVRANAIICLIHQANYLLDRQIATLEAAFIDGGRYTEQLAAESMRQPKDVRTDRTDRADSPEAPPPPACPACGSPMARRTAKTGKAAGKPFWGCTRYPDCKGTAAA